MGEMKFEQVDTCRSRFTFGIKNHKMYNKHYSFFLYHFEKNNFFFSNIQFYIQIIILDVFSNKIFI